MTSPPIAIDSIGESIVEIIFGGYKQPLCAVGLGLSAIYCVNGQFLFIHFGSSAVIPECQTAELHL